MEIQNKTIEKGKFKFGIRLILAVAVITLMSWSCLSHGQKTNANLSSKIEDTTVVRPKRIGVIGAGWLGGTVGGILVKAGYEVMFSSRHPEELKAMAEKLGAKASVGTPKQAAAFGEVLLFAVPYDAIPQLGIDLKDDIKGKIILDACNGGSGDLGQEVQANGAGVTSAKYLKGSRLVRAFSSEDATAVESSFKRTNNKLAIPVAGNDKQAVEMAAQLISDAGCEPVIVGNLASGIKFQRGTPAFRANTNAAELRRLLGMNENK